MNKIKIPKKIKELMTALQTNGFEAYIIGGAVRDSLLEQEPHDWDIFTNATGKQILDIFPRNKILGGEERQTKILTVIVNGVEISQFRCNGDRTKTGNDLLTHQSTCDLTINSIAANIKGEITETNKYNKQGLQDIGNKIISFVGNPNDRINEDYLRILRAVRFYLQLGNFKFDEKTMGAIIHKHHLINKLPKERIREEFVKCLKYKNCIKALVYSGLLSIILPEFSLVKDMEGGDHHSENVDQHMFLAFETACDITDDWRIRLAAFLHDIGKGSCKSNNEEEGIHFYEHEKIGANMTKIWMKDMKFPNEDIEFVSTLIKYHMWSYKAGEISKKAYLRMFNKFREMSVSIHDFVMLIYCDHQVNLKKPRIKLGDFVKGSWVLQRYWECVYQKEPFNKGDLELQGGDIIKIIGKEPGSWVGKLMDNMLEAIMNDELVNDRRELIKWVKRSEK